MAGNSGARPAPAASVSSATAPEVRACSAYEAPCARPPGAAAKRSPGRTPELLIVMPVTGTSAPFRTASGPAAGTRSRRVVAATEVGRGTPCTAATLLIGRAGRTGHARDGV